jgi:ribosomal protein S18 acetylase RimI-like enzyme
MTSTGDLPACRPLPETANAASFSHASRGGRTTTPSIKLEPAERFTFEELVAIYNRARVDYIVPMPMNAARLREYVHDYDVDLALSAVAVAADGPVPVGMAMLGVRPGHTWITRLGVLPASRRRGTGRRLMEHLIAHSGRLGVPCVALEVIKGNTPAECLFRALGFRATRELLVIRRPPGPPHAHVSRYALQVLEEDEAIGLLARRRDAPTWLNETSSLLNGGGLAGLCVDLEDGGSGWLAYRRSDLLLSRLVLQTEAGDPQRVGQALINALHTRHPTLDTKSENLPLNDPHWPALHEMGYIESFCRIEMRLDTV